MSLDPFLQAYDEALAEDAVSLSSEENVARYRAPSLRRWLFWLGYLKQLKELPEVDAALLRAIAQFQDDAGYASNSDLDTCWMQVRQFVIVERESGESGWLEAQSKAHSPAVKRALFLRLHMLGIVDPAPGVGIDEKELARGVNNFCVAAYCLGHALDPRNRFEVHQAILGQDVLIERLKRFGGKHALRYSSAWDSPERKRAQLLAFTLVDGCARVELWLAGYNTRFQGRGSLRSDTPNSSTLATALQQFWKDQPAELRPQGYKSEKRPQPEFFQRVALLSNTAPKEPDFVLEEDIEIAEQLRDSRFRSEIRRSYRSIVEVIFDGAKRAINWMWNLFKRATNSLLQKARNLARLLKVKALALADAVATVVKAVACALKYLFASQMPGSDPGQMIVRHRFDFDYDLFLDETASPDKVARISRILALSGEVLGYSLQFLALLGRIVARLLSRVATPIGWLGAIVAISRLKSLFDDSFSLRQNMAYLTESYRELEAVRLYD